MGPAEVIISVERRRRWTAQQKQAMVEEVEQPGNSISSCPAPNKPIGFVKFMRLENRLSELAEVKVELVTKNTLKPNIGQHILQEVIYV